MLDGEDALSISIASPIPSNVTTVWVPDRRAQFCLV